MFQCLPDDPKITELDETTKTWMFFSWSEDKTEKHIMLRNQGCLIGSFWNPAAANEIMGTGNSQKVSVSDQEFEKAFQTVVDDRIQKEKDKQKKIPKKRRAKRLVVRDQKQGQ